MPSLVMNKEDKCLTCWLPLQQSFIHHSLHPFETFDHVAGGDKPEKEEVTPLSDLVKESKVEGILRWAVNISVKTAVKKHFVMAQNSMNSATPAPSPRL